MFLVKSDSRRANKHSHCAFVLREWKEQEEPGLNTSRIKILRISERSPF